MGPYQVGIQGEELLETMANHITYVHSVVQGQGQSVIKHKWYGYLPSREEGPDCHPSE